MNSKFEKVLFLLHKIYYKIWLFSPNFKINFNYLNNNLKLNFSKSFLIIPIIQNWPLPWYFLLLLIFIHTLLCSVFIREEEIFQHFTVSQYFNRDSICRLTSYNKFHNSRLCDWWDAWCPDNGWTTWKIKQRDLLNYWIFHKLLSKVPLITLLVICCVLTLATGTWWVPQRMWQLHGISSSRWAKHEV